MKRWVSFVFGAIVVAGLAWLIQSHRTPEHNLALSARELATRGLGQQLAQSGQCKRVLVVANPFAPAGKLTREMRDMEEAGLRGLKAGLGDKVSVEVAWPELKPGVLENPRAVFIDPETTTPLSYLVAPDAFDKLAQQHTGCDIIVSLIGLPAELSRVRCWQDANGPKFALLLPDLRVVGDRATVRASLESRKLMAFVMAKPGVAVKVAAKAEDWHSEFDRQFVLITRENFEVLLRAYPQLFPTN
jgi:hypothetical protein